MVAGAADTSLPFLVHLDPDVFNSWIDIVKDALFRIQFAN
jgi:hypothetical protein